MFTYTTTTLINSSKDLTTGLPLWSKQAADTTKGTPASFTVKRAGKFVADNISAIYKAAGSEAENAKVTIDLSQANGTKGDTFRLDIYIGLTQASQDSRYANDLVLKGKPFSVDFIWKDDAATTATALVKTLNKYEILVYGDKLLDVTNSGTFITIEAKNEYQRFVKIDIDKFDKTAYFGMGEYTVVHSLDDIDEVDTNAAVTSDTEARFVGKEGFGTYPYILHNLRLPTEEATDAFAPYKNEAPIPGALYDQFTIHYCVDRGPLGMNAVGDQVKSVTTHVFYVKSDLSADFEAALKTVAPTDGIIEVPTKA